MKEIKIPYEIRELSRQKALTFHKVINSPTPEKVTAGQIWSTKSKFELPDGRRFETEEPRLIFVFQADYNRAEAYKHVVGFPISVSTEMASIYDCILPKEESNLDFEFMIEVWNETPVLVGQLSRYVGALSEHQTAQVQELYFSYFHGDVISAGFNLTIGSQIYGESDPRFAFQEKEIFAVSYLANAATAALELDDVPEEEGTKINGNWHKFEFEPFFAKLSGIFKNRETAFAATFEEEERFLIHNPSPEYGFTFELLSRKRPPYIIYIEVLKVSPELLGHTCMVSVKAEFKSWNSKMCTLLENSIIEVGQDPEFRREEVDTVELEVEVN